MSDIKKTNKKANLRYLIQLFIFASFLEICNSGLSQNLIQTIPDTAFSTFGIGCGLRAKVPVSMLKTIRLVNSSNKTQLESWLELENPQSKIYGYIGLYFLEQNGLILSKDIKYKMKTVRKSSAIVDYCSGCAMGRKESIKNLLSSKKLKRYYDWYVRSNYKEF